MDVRTFPQKVPFKRNSKFHLGLLQVCNFVTVSYMLLWLSVFYFLIQTVPSGPDHIPKGNGAWNHKGKLSRKMT